MFSKKMAETGLLRMRVEEAKNKIRWCSFVGEWNRNITALGTFLILFLI